MKDLIKLNRFTKDIGVFGKKGIGKTLLISGIGFLRNKLYGDTIFSNYPLSYDHYFINNLIKPNTVVAMRMIAANDPFVYSLTLHPKNRMHLTTDSTINKIKQEEIAIMLTAQAALYAIIHRKRNI